jgi:hypothetical protein
MRWPARAKLPIAGALLWTSGCAGSTTEGASVPVVSGLSAVAPAVPDTTAPTPTPPSSSDTRVETASPAPAAARTVLGDRDFYTRDSYIAYASPWCAQLTTKLEVGKDLVDTISLAPSTFPNGVVIATAAPNADPTQFGCGVYGYHAISFGNYDGGSPQVPVRPRQVRSIAALTVQVEIGAQSTTGDYNLLNEFYLTSAAGDSAAKTVEIGFFLHPSTSATILARTGALIGTHTDPSGRDWEVRKVGTFIMLLPADHADMVSGTLDMKAVLAFLFAQKAISGEEWFNGTALGIEPVRGDTTVTIAHYGVTLD